MKPVGHAIFSTGTEELPGTLELLPYGVLTREIALREFLSRDHLSGVDPGLPSVGSSSSNDLINYAGLLGMWLSDRFSNPSVAPNFLPTNRHLGCDWYMGKAFRLA